LTCVPGGQSSLVPLARTAPQTSAPPSALALAPRRAGLLVVTLVQTIAWRSGACTAMPRLRAPQLLCGSLRMTSAWVAQTSATRQSRLGWAASFKHTGGQALGSLVVLRVLVRQRLLMVRTEHCWRSCLMTTRTSRVACLRCAFPNEEASSWWVVTTQLIILARSSTFP